MYRIESKAKNDLQSYTIAGTVGNVEFDEDNVLKGSLSVTNQCSDVSTFNLGGVYIGEMNATFMGLNIARNDWVGREVELSVTVNGSDDIPVGVFVIDEAKHTKGYTKVKAYDRMIYFDKAISLDVGAYGSVYQFLTQACSECHVPLGMTEAEVRALPNGTQPFVLEEMGDIETWRDLIYWLASGLMSFATVDRSGNLVLRKYHSTVDDTIDYNIRYNISSYGDEIISYTGLNVTITDEKTTYYYHNEPDDGYTLNLGQNPFMQGPREQRDIYINNLLSVLGDISYNACSVSIPFGIHYDLGDVLKFPNGEGSQNNKFCIMGYTWIYGGEYKLTSIAGKNVGKSKTDKNLQGIINSVGRNEFTAYEMKNLSAITIADGEEERLIMARIASNTKTKAQIHVEVNLDSEAASNYTSANVRYLVNSEEDTTIYPSETYIDGNHVLHLMYILPVAANSMNQFEIYMEADGGDIEIPQGGVWLYASGAGLVGDGKWDGTITVQDYAPEFEIVEVTFADANDNVTVATQVPVGDSISETASGWDIVAVVFEGADDSVTMELHTDVYRRLLEDGSVRITEDGKVRYTEGD